MTKPLVFISMLLLCGCATARKSERGYRSTASGDVATFIPGYSAAGEGYKQAVQRILASSSVKKSVDVIQFNFNAASSRDPFVESLGKQLKTLAAEGRKVRVLIEDGGYGVGTANHAGGDAMGSGIEVDYIHGLANPVDSTSPGILHSKVVIVDGHLILAGSTNWSDRSISANPSAKKPANNEADLLIDSIPLGQALTQYADRLAAQSSRVPTELVSRSQLSTGQFEDQGVSVFFDAEYFPELLRFIAGAQAGDQLDCSMYTLGAGDSGDPQHQGDQALHALLGATSRGVKLRMVFDNDRYNSYGTPLNHHAADQLLSSADAIYFTEPNVITHQKFCVLTAKNGTHTALIGSSNWDYVDLSLNHQVNWLVNEDRPAADLEAYFTGLVANLTPYQGD